MDLTIQQKPYQPTFTLHTSEIFAPGCPTRLGHSQADKGKMKHVSSQLPVSGARDTTLPARVGGEIVKD